MILFLLTETTYFLFVTLPILLGIISTIDCIYMNEIRGELKIPEAYIHKKSIASIVS